MPFSLSLSLCTSCTTTTNSFDKQAPSCSPTLLNLHRCLRQVRPTRSLTCWMICTPNLTPWWSNKVMRCTKWKPSGTRTWWWGMLVYPLSCCLIQCVYTGSSRGRQLCCAHIEVNEWTKCEAVVLTHCLVCAIVLCWTAPLCFLCVVVFWWTAPWLSDEQWFADENARRSTRRGNSTIGHSIDGSR